MKERGVRDDPSFVELGDQVSTRHANVVEENFVEAAIAGHLHERTNGDSRRMHVDQNVRNPAMLGRFGICPHQTEHHVRVLRAGGPHFLPVDDKLVADDFRARLQRGQVGACAGLGVSLAPDFFCAENFRQIAFLLFLGAPRDQRRPEHPESRPANQVRRSRPHHLVVDDRLPDRVHLLPAVFLRPRERDITSVIQFPLPRFRLPEPLFIFATLPPHGEIFGHIFREPTANLKPKRFFFSSEL